MQDVNPSSVIVLNHQHKHVISPAAKPPILGMEYSELQKKYLRKISDHTAVHVFTPARRSSAYCGAAVRMLHSHTVFT